MVLGENICRKNTSDESSSKWLIVGRERICPKAMRVKKRVHLKLGRL